MNLSFHPTNRIFINYDDILNVFKKYLNEKVFYIKYEHPPININIIPSKKQYIFIYYKYPGFNENNILLNSECLMITLYEGKKFILNLLKYQEPNICKISGVELLCLLYKVAKELKFNISIPQDLSFKYYTLKENLSVKGKINLADYYILLKGDSWYGQYGYFSENHNNEKNYNEQVRNLSISNYFNEGHNQGQEKEDVNEIINFINNLHSPKITYETPIKDVMNILDNIKRQEEKKGILYLNNKVIVFIRLIIKQDLIHYDNKNLLLDINNPEIDNIYNNICDKLKITINTGGKKYRRRKKTIRKKVKKLKRKYTYKNKKI